MERLRSLVQADGGDLLSDDESTQLTALLARARPWLAAWEPRALLEAHTSDYPVQLQPSGYVVHIRHDDAPVALARSLDQYVALAIAHEGIPRDPEPALAIHVPERTHADEALSDALLAQCSPEPADGWFGGVAVAIQLTARTPVLIRLLRSRDLWVREAAAHRLGGIGDPAGLPALTTLAAQEGQDARAAQRAIARIRGEGD